MSYSRTKQRFSNCVCIKQTDKAILVMDTKSSVQTWVPQSQIDDDSDVYCEGTEGNLVVSDWMGDRLEWKEV